MKAIRHPNLRIPVSTPQLPPEYNPTPPIARRGRKLVKPDELRDWLWEHDCQFIASDELSALVGTQEEHLPDLLSSVIEAGDIVQVTSTSWAPTYAPHLFLYMPVVDALMRHLDCAYYIGWMSAGELHGATHYRSGRLMVAVERELPELEFVPSYASSAFSSDSTVRPGDRYLTAVKDNIFDIPCEIKIVGMSFNLRHQMRAKVSSKVATILDCVERSDLAGGIFNLANIAHAFVALEGFNREERNQHRMNPKELAETAMLFPLDVRQRCGYLLSYTKWRTFYPWYSLRPLHKTLPRKPEIVDYGDDPFCEKLKLNRRWKVSVSQKPEYDW